jgi:hypothetical protein
MNAPISAALLQLRATAPAAEVQPTVPSSLALLAEKFVFKGLLLDLYGHADEADGCSVEAVALTGSVVNLASVFTLAQLTTIGWALDKAGVEQRAASAVEDRADRAAWDKAAMS